MNIGVFGDSFADPRPGQPDRSSEAWMHQLEAITGHRVDSFGESGVSAWYSYKVFLEHYQKFDTVVFVYTSVNRIHNVPCYHDNTHYNFVRPDTIEHLEFLTDSEKDRIRNTVNTYWRELQDDAFDLFVYQSVFDAVNSKCAQAGINLINVFPFENFHQPDTVDLSNTQGDCYRGLMCVSSQEAEAATEHMGSYAYDSRDCHLTEINNINFAKLIAKSIDSNTKTVYSISENNAPDYGFVFGAEYIDKYFEGS